jgi:hypothetical protein
VFTIVSNNERGEVNLKDGKLFRLKQGIENILLLEEVLGIILFRE